jgi:hypothetical protein
VRVTACWPTTSANFCGRHLRAITWYDMGNCRIQIADRRLIPRLQIEPRPGESCGTCQDLLSAAAFRP